MRHVSDEELLKLLHATETQPPLPELIEEDAPLEEGPEREPCLHCGEPAEHFGECILCREGGCLPPDLWSPGMNEPCLTLCVRCAREIHVGCSIEDEAGNPRCPTCPF